MNKKYLWVSFLIILGLVIIITTIVSILPKAPKEVKEQVIMYESSIPDDFFKLPEKEEKPVVKKVESIPEPDANDVFKVIKPVIDVARIAEGKRLKEKLEERKKYADARPIVFSKRNHFGQIEGVVESYDNDFSEHNIEFETATYPVNLERVLTVDRMIEVTLITEIRSERPSEKVIAQVTRDVYASHGNKVLIPWGTKAIGRYRPLNRDGDTRLDIEWYRMITPNGINIKFTAEVADLTGSSGVTGDVDERSREKYGAAMLLATISAAGQMIVPVGRDAYQAAANSYSDALSNVTAEAIKQSFDLKPRVMIKRGEIINISVLKDLHFKKPKGGQIEVEPFDYEKTYNEDE